MSALVERYKRWSDLVAEAEANPNAPEQALAAGMAEWDTILKSPARSPEDLACKILMLLDGLSEEELGTDSMEGSLLSDAMAVLGDLPAS